MASVAAWSAAMVSCAFVYLGIGIVVAVAFWRSARTPDADASWPPDWAAVVTVLLWPIALVFLGLSIVMGFIGDIVRGSMK
jgi:hypothetical protein